MEKTVAVILGVSLIFIGSVAFAADNAVACGMMAKWDLSRKNRGSSHR